MSRAGHGAINSGEQAGPPVAGQRPRDFQIDPRGGINRHDPAGIVAGWRLQAGFLAELGFLDVGDDAGRRRQFGAGHLAEPVDGCHLEIMRNPVCSRRHIEERRWHRSDGLVTAPERFQVRVVEQAIRYDDFAGVDTSQFGTEPGECTFADPERSGRHVDPGETKCCRVICRRFHAGDDEQVIGSGGIKERIFGNCPRSHETRYIPPHNGLGSAFAGFRRIFQLFADGNAKSERDQSLQIFI